VVITGIGVVSPVGIGIEAFWEGLLGGRCGVGRIQAFDPEGFGTEIAAEVKDFRPEDYMDRRTARRIARFSQFAVAAARLAQEDAGIAPRPEATEDIGIILGVSVNGVQPMEEEIRKLLEKGPGSVHPFGAARCYPGAGAANISVELGLGGESTTISTGCSASTNAIGYAFRNIKLGLSDVIFAGGTEAPVTPVMVSTFRNARTLSSRNSDPQAASRPFERSRDGWVLGEGASILVLEEREAALRRGARAYAEIRGYASNSDRFDVLRVCPDETQASRAFKSACREARINPEDVEYVNAHGSSSVTADLRETRALKRVLGRRAYKVPVSSLKSMVGHPLGASGSLQAAACALAIERGAVPPTINYEEPDEECDLDYVPNEARDCPVGVAMNQALGLGGNNACLVMARA
jgi:3-oxoacyl-[acyl-carrier-protein] synthase II